MKRNEHFLDKLIKVLAIMLLIALFALTSVKLYQSFQTEEETPSSSIIEDNVIGNEDNTTDNNNKADDEDDVKDNNETVDEDNTKYNNPESNNNSSVTKGELVSDSNTSAVNEKGSSEALENFKRSRIKYLKSELLKVHIELALSRIN